MFKLHQLRPEGGDCTAPYAVDLGGEYTVREFIRDVLLDKREWGYIGIDIGHNSIFGDPCCEYSHGGLKTSLPAEFLTMKVVSAKASGGWSRMDYLLTTETHTMTERVQKALKCCIVDRIYAWCDCRDCPYFDMTNKYSECKELLLNDALALIGKKGEEK